jgi:gamma-glutamylputrescine oxidase
MISDSVSYWQQTAPNLQLSIDVPRSVDVAVIGGGLMGVATCYWLAREGISVALLERESIGWGATGRNGGLVVAGPAGTYPDAIARLGQETAYAALTDTLTNQRLLQDEKFL